MAGSFNKVFILGNLGQDPELRYTPNQVPVATLNVATTDFRTGPDGQRQDVTEWHRVVVWSKQAENCAKYLAKGRTVFVEGRLQTRSWDDKTTGQKRYSTEIVAQNIQFVGSAGARSDGANQNRYADGGNRQDSAATVPDFETAGPTQNLTGIDAAGFDDIPF